MLRFVETREDAYGVDLDYVLDFIEYCRKGRGIIGSGMAKAWIQKYGAEVGEGYDYSINDLVRAALLFVKERGTRDI